VNSFTHERKIMSVVAQINGRQYIFLKGAPEKVWECCAQGSDQPAQLWEKYERGGLRCLSVSYREIADDCNWRGLPASELEKDHTFLGTVGIEDALQQDVQLTMDLLSHAGLKLWVATGDAWRNTLVTAAKLRLIAPDEKRILHLTEEVLTGLGSADERLSFVKRVRELKRNSFSILIDCANRLLIRSLMEDRDLLRVFLEARCVIFYRCVPNAKTEIVVALQNMDMRVLGVGDGANDSGLLKMADVGIGILGKKGAKAFAGCDFPLPAFRCLGRLILVHGHTAFHRTVLAVNFSFYKAVLCVVCELVYQFWTDFTAQSFFDQSSLVFFNNIWTLLPLV
jgi:magnesium-transporting ATPase (P-type)